MGKIYFIRHGESEWNVTDQICGQTDVPLTEKGHKQAEKTGKNIVESGISADLILCSPLLRAKQTAQHIAEMTGIPLQVEPRLVEQNFDSVKPLLQSGGEERRCLPFWPWQAMSAAPAGRQ